MQLHPADGEHAALAGSIEAWGETLSSAHTRRAYLGPVLRLVHRYGSITGPGLRQLRDDMLAEGRSARTVHRTMTAAVSCATWLVDRGFAPAEILPPLQAVPRPQRDPSAPKRADVRQGALDLDA
jgi:hypothetical protein